MVDKTLRVENPANKPMHYGERSPIGVLNPPDKLPFHKLYSYFDGVLLFRKLDYDTYEMQRRAKPKKGKFPPVLKLIGGLIIGGLLFSTGIKGAKKLFGKIFRR